MTYKEAKMAKGSGQEIVKTSQPLYNIWELSSGEVVRFSVGVMTISPALLRQCPRVPLDELEHTDWELRDIVQIDW